MRDKSIRIQMILLIAALTFFVVFVGGVFYYATTSKYMEIEMQDSNEAMMQNTTASYEIFLENTIDTILLYLNDNSLFLEQEAGGYVARVFSQLRNITAFSDYIVNVYYFDRNLQTIYLSDGISFDYDDFYDSGWVSSLDPEKELYILPARKMPTLTGGEKEIIPIVIQYPFRAAEPMATYIINLDASRFFEHVVSNVENGRDSRFRIADESGMVFISTDRAYHFMNLAEIPHLQAYQDAILSRAQGRFMTEADGQKLLVSYRASPQYNWIYLSELDYARFEANLRQPLYILLAISLALFAVGIASAFVISKRMYRPLEELMGAFSLSRGRNEVDAIREYMSKSVEENAELKAHMEAGRVYMRRQFLCNLLTRNIYQEQEAEEYLAEIGCEREGVFVTVVFELSRYETLVQTIPVNEWAMWEFAFENVAKEIGEQYGQVHYTSMENSRFALVFRFADGTAAQSAEQTVEQAAERITDSLKQHLKFELVAGISGTCGSVLDIHKLYVQSVTAIRLSGLTVGVASYSPYNRNPVQPGISLRQEDALSKWILLGNGEAAVAYLRELYRDFLARHREGGHNGPQFFFFQILSLIMRFLIEFELKESEVLAGVGSYADFCMMLASVPGREENIAHLEASIAALCDSISAKRSAVANSRLSAVSDYIHAHYGEELSLDIIAEQTGVGKTQISRLIKEHFDTSFVNYVNQIRIEKAVALVEQTDSKVYEIAEAVGFHNTHYFIKIFKSFTGQTPGQMKESRRKG
ncbi:AraC family transcriptional regulator [Ruminococcaceae bacterium OttesenSCG-928-L11]|nr:AraC family transcriptional regulator [Ruminococcaceae bacterium OttesenSCG-928-L11]